MAKRGYKQSEEHKARRFASKRETLSLRPKPYTREWLHQKYIVEGLSCPEIGALVSRNPKGIWSWLRYYGIPTRPRGGHTTPHAFKPGQTSLFLGRKHTPETRALLRQRSLEDGRVPYLRNGKHWLATVAPEDHPNWRGGTSPERQAFYSSPEWREAVKAVWKRDNATCQWCGKHHNTAKSRGTFHIHHIVSFMVVELRAEPSNLVLLCKRCHLFVHSRRNRDRAFLSGSTLFDPST